MQKLLEVGAKPVTLSDSDGFIHDPDGIDEDKLAYVMELKNVRRGRIKEYAEQYDVAYYEGKKPWDIPCNAAFPCATQNELCEPSAEALLRNGCRLVAEGQHAYRAGGRAPVR